MKISRLPSSYLLLGLLGIQAFAIVATFPNWIPSWAIAPWLIAGMCYALGLGLAIVLLRRLHRKLRIHLPQPRRTLTLIAAAIALLGCLAFTGLATGFFASGGLFPKVWVRTFDFPKENTTLYIYDVSFLDPSFELFARTSALPFMHSVSVCPICFPPAEEAHRDGDWVEIPPFRYHLLSGEVQHQPK